MIQSTYLQTCLRRSISNGRGMETLAIRLFSTTPTQTKVVLDDFPPAVRRELLRHVTVRTTTTAQQAQTQQNQQQQHTARSASSNNRPSMKYVLAGCIALTATAASFPLVATWWIQVANESKMHSKPGGLTAAQNRRGVFMNSGSKDVGADPDWDFQRGVYTKPTGYAAEVDRMTEQEKERAEIAMGKRPRK
jgi:hypothetical protein